MTEAIFELLVPLFHNCVTETPHDQPIHIFTCNREGCDFSTRYEMLEPQRNGARGPLGRRMREVGPRKGKVQTCYGFNRPLPDFRRNILHNMITGASPPDTLDWTDARGRLHRVRCVRAGNAWSYSDRA